MNFKSFDEDSIDCTKKYILSQKYRICDFTIGSILMWGTFFDYQYAVESEMLFIKGVTLEDETMFAVPIGFSSFSDAIKLLINYCKESRINFLLSNVPAEAVEELKKDYQLDVEILPDWFDYLYDVNDLMFLKGKKYQAKRNHINKFTLLYPNYQYKEITNADFDRLREFNKKFLEEKDSEDEFLVWEMNSIEKLFNCYQKYHFLGGYLEVDNEIVAYSIGEIIDDTLYVHIEKSNRNYLGSYATINRDFIKNNYNEKIKYINREEDVGNLGLRKAKESYYPIKLINRYQIKISNIK